MAQELISHKVLSLDFWQDTVTYAGSVMPTGTIGCAVLNIPDEMITRLDAPCMILNQLLTGIGLKNVDMQLLPKAQEAGRAIIHELHDVQPFSHLDRKQFEDYLTPAFSEEAFAELNNYLQLSMEQQALSGVMGTQAAPEAAGTRPCSYRNAEADRVPQKEQKNSRRCLPVSGGQRRRMGWDSV